MCENGIKFIMMLCILSCVLVRVFFRNDKKEMKNFGVILYIKVYFWRGNIIWMLKIVFD